MLPPENYEMSVKYHNTLSSIRFTSQLRADGASSQYKGLFTDPSYIPWIVAVFSNTPGLIRCKVTKE